MVTITEPLVRKLLTTVDAGLVQGIGIPKPGKMCVGAATSYALGEPHNDEPSCVDPNVRLVEITLNDATWSSTQARARGMRRVAIAALGSRDTIDTVQCVRLFTNYTIREMIPVLLRATAKITPSFACTLEDRAVQCERDGDEAAARAAHFAASEAARVASFAVRAAASEAARAAHFAASEAARVASFAASEAAMAAARAAHFAASFAVRAAASEAVRVASIAGSDASLSLSATLMVRALQECRSPGCDWLWLVDETAGEVQR